MAVTGGAVSGSYCQSVGFSVTGTVSDSGSKWQLLWGFL